MFTFSTKSIDFVLLDSNYFRIARAMLTFSFKITYYFLNIFSLHFGQGTFLI